MLKISGDFEIEQWGRLRSYEKTSSSPRVWAYHSTQNISLTDDLVDPQLPRDTCPSRTTQGNTSTVIGN